MLPYEQIGSGVYPERTGFNQKHREWDSWAVDNMRFGGVKPYDADINYFQFARCTVGLHKFVALVANGPALGNTTHPQAANQSIWRLY